MQIDIRHQRTNYCPLRRPYLCLRPLAILTDSRLQPFRDQTQNPRVGHPVLDEFDGPFVTYLVEKAANVRVQNPSHPLPLDAHTQRIQRLVRTPSRTKPVAESPKVHLVYRIENGNYGLLDDLILQRRNPDRSLPPVGLRYVDPPRRLRPVRSTVYPVLQIS